MPAMCASLLPECGSIIPIQKPELGGIPPDPQPQFMGPRDQAQARARCAHMVLSAYLNTRHAGSEVLHSSNQTSDHSYFPKGNVWTGGSTPTPTHGFSDPLVKTSWTIQTYSVLGPRWRSPAKPGCQEHSACWASKELCG